MRTQPIPLHESGARHGITSELFGAIAPNFFGWDHLTEDFDELGVSFIRFPGGTLSERGVVQDGQLRLGNGLADYLTNADRSHVAYDLTHPELIAPEVLALDDLDVSYNNIAAFSDVLEYARQNNDSVSLILPVERYYAGIDLSNSANVKVATAAAKADLEVFLDRLVSGYFNEGRALPQLTLEIGNEQYDAPIEYALIARTFLKTLEDRLGESDVRYDVALQAGVGSQRAAQLAEQGYFDRFYSGSEPTLFQLAGFDYENVHTMTFAERIDITDRLIQHIVGDALAHVTAIRHHYLGLDRQSLSSSNGILHQRDEIVALWQEAYKNAGGLRDALDYYVSAWTVDSDNGSGQMFGQAAAGNMLFALDHFLDMDVDAAALWGVLGSYDYDPEAALTTPVSVRTEQALSPAGYVYSLMAEYLPGTERIDWDMGIPGQSETTGFAFEGTTEIYVFAVNGEDHDGSLAIDLGLLGIRDSVDGFRVATMNGSASGLGYLSQTDFNVTEAAVQVQFEQAYEVIMLTIPKTYGFLPDGNYPLNPADIARFTKTPILAGEFPWSDGTPKSDLMVGDARGNLMSDGPDHSPVTFDPSAWGTASALGRNNGDFLFGMGGPDSLSGYGGNDWLDGGEGDDLLFGGEGYDTFVFNEGLDVIYDYDPAFDTILVRKQLLDGKDLQDFVVPTPDHPTVLDIDFGDGNALTVFGPAPISVDDINFY